MLVVTGGKGDACVLGRFGINRVVTDIEDVFLVQPEMAADGVDSVRGGFGLGDVFHADDEVDEAFHLILPQRFTDARPGLGRDDATVSAGLFRRGASAGSADREVLAVMYLSEKRTLYSVVRAWMRAGSVSPVRAGHGVYMAHADRAADSFFGDTVIAFGFEEELEAQTIPFSEFARV